ncbi:MAG: phosphatidylglycerol lysyltransferase domain-containing protein [Clostridia bacterium]|nr:phosphatidylglycerol lysyltransferase domain-containing protein [Clostridia bacterium]
MTFKDIELSDREWMEPLFSKTSRGSLEYSFTSNFIWRNIFKVKVAKIDNYLVIISDRDKPTYLFPAGEGNIKPVIDALIEDAHSRGSTLVFHTVLPDAKALLETLYPEKFEFTLLRDSADYIYTAQSLRTLTGKKLSSKRNHINAFTASFPDWSYEPITPQNIDEAFEMNKKWCQMSECGKSESLKNEACAVRQAFEHFFELGLDGGLLRADGRVVAFSMGDKLNDDTYLVHIEKAFPDVRGAYPMINKQFVLHNCDGYTYVNREDDAGDDGLRKAKLSYVPFRLVEKYCARYKENGND